MFLVKAYLPVNESFGKLYSRIVFIAFGVSSSALLANVCIVSQSQNVSLVNTLFCEMHLPEPQLSWKFQVREHFC